MGKRTAITREIDLEEKGIKGDTELTNLKKNAFIVEIQNGLGEDIRKNPNRVKMPNQKKKKFIDFIKRLFTKF